MSEIRAMRDAFGQALRELGRSDRDVVVLSGDLEDATRAEYFQQEFPERFFNLGIAEADLAGTAAGLALSGLIPFVCSFAAFLPTRAFDALRVSVCYNRCNVKLVATHAGLTVGADGATAQSLEDIAITRSLPNMVVLAPCDAREVAKAVRKMAQINAPVYMRLSRQPSAVITGEADAFEIGMANTVRSGSAATIIACGLMVAEAVAAAEQLAETGMAVRVLNMHTIKPLDEAAIVRAAAETGAMVTAEEHQIHGGLGSAVAEVVVRRCPVPMEMVAVRDRFGESGTPRQLLEQYELTAGDIVRAVQRVVQRKTGRGQ